MQKVDTNNLPERMKAKFEQLNSEVISIANDARKLVHAAPTNHVSYQIENAALNQDILTDDEGFQCDVFMARFKTVSTFKAAGIFPDKGRWYFTGIMEAINIITSFRPILHNQSDVVHYKKVHDTLAKMLTRECPADGTTIRILDKHNNDLTRTFLKCYGSNIEAVEFLKSKLELDYLYNGFLQHSDTRFKDRFSKDWHSGEINYILIKHAFLMNTIKELLSPHYFLIRQFNPHFRLGYLD